MSINYRGNIFSAYNTPKLTPNGPKKRAVLAKVGDKVKLVRFGDKKLTVKSGNPERKKNYCARSSGQGNTKNKLSANYWSRRQWGC